MAIKQDNTRIIFTIDKASAQFIDSLVQAELINGRKMTRSKYVKMVVSEFLRDKAMTEFNSLTTE